MLNYRRVLIPGVTYFFTVVTYKRRKSLMVGGFRFVTRTLGFAIRKPVGMITAFMLSQNVRVQVANMNPRERAARPADRSGYRNLMSYFARRRKDFAGNGLHYLLKM